MNIIFGESVKDFPDSYTILELDTFRLPPDNKHVTAFCVIERVSLQDFPLLEARAKLHQDLMDNYKKGHWDFCEQAITEGLMGKWNGELDSFYKDLLQRVQANKIQAPGPDWSPVIDKSAV